VPPHHVASPPVAHLIVLLQAGFAKPKNLLGFRGNRSYRCDSVDKRPVNQCFTAYDRN
jgi:hypothetical protein